MSPDLPNPSELNDLLSYLEPHEIAEIDSLLATSQTDWQSWLQTKFPHVCTHPFAPRHVRLWQWFTQLEKGVKPLPRVDVWPRGGAKSSTAELAAAFVGITGRRMYVLYVSGTQDQADKHVSAIASHLERAGVDRSINKYGNSRGWRRNQLRAANGFNVEALGLDTAARGIKLDEFRPDLIILDDVDDQNDSPKTVEKKERAIKSAIIPAGSTDCAVLFIQNKIHEIGIVSRLVDDRADYLLDREEPSVEPAAYNLEYESVDRGDGRKVWKVLSGEPTWEGQSLDVIQSQMNDWGLKTFLREAQHEVYGADGYFFDVSKIETALALPDIRDGWSFVLSSDFASTQGGGDYTAIRLWARTPQGIYYLVKSWRGQWSSDHARKAHREAVEWSRLVVGDFLIRFKQDPAQAGKDQAEQLEARYANLRTQVRPDTGKKADRAETLAELVNLGNVRFVSDAWEPDEAKGRAWPYAAEQPDWNYHSKEEYRKFREDEQHEFDDQVDADADAVNELAQARVMSAL